MPADPVKKIKDYILALNDIAYDDDVRLELYFTRLKETLQQIFGSHSQYLTYLNSICFHPFSTLAPVEENVRCWAQGKRQVRDLLFVVLQDPVLKECGSDEDQELDRAAQGEVAAAERIVAAVDENAGGRARVEIASSLPDVIRAFKKKVRVDLSSAALIHGVLRCGEGLSQRPLVPERAFRRVRIDLSCLDVLDDGVETYWVHPSSFLPKNRQKKVLLVPSASEDVDRRVRGFFCSSEATLVEASDFSSLKNFFDSPPDDRGAVEMAVVVLSADHCLPWTNQEGGRGVSWDASFQLGYLVSKLGPRRVIALYEESLKFHRPAGYFELVYIPMTEAGVWRRELAECLKDNNVAVREAGQPVFFRE